MEIGATIFTKLLQACTYDILHTPAALTEILLKQQIDYFARRADWSNFGSGRSEKLATIETFFMHSMRFDEGNQDRQGSLTRSSSCLLFAKTSCKRCEYLTQLIVGACKSDPKR